MSKPGAQNQPILTAVDWRTLFQKPAESSSIQLLRYFFVGGLSFAVDFLLLFGLTSGLGIDYLISTAIAFLAGVTANYLLSRSWVFPSRTLSNSGVEFSVFALIGIVGLGMTEAGMWFLTGVIGFHYLLSKIVVAIVVFFWNFIARKVVLFS